MRHSDQKSGGNSVTRMILVGISLLFQVGWLLLQILLLNEYSAWISLATGILSACVVLKLYSKQVNAAMKMPWIMLILAFPIMGLSMYLLFELLGDPGVSRRLKAVRQRTQGHLDQQETVWQNLRASSPALEGQFRYLWNTAGSPVYENTAVR